MSTTEQSAKSEPRSAAQIETRRRRRLENLLTTRRRVAQFAAEYRSHDLDDAVELYLLQLEIEQVIADEFPIEFDEQVAEWAFDEAYAEHHPLAWASRCTICRAMAAAYLAAGTPRAA